MTKCLDNLENGRPRPNMQQDACEVRYDFSMSFVLSHLFYVFLKDCSHAKILNVQRMPSTSKEDRW